MPTFLKSIVEEAPVKNKRNYPQLCEASITPLEWVERGDRMCYVAHPEVVPK
jgi:hypothetical protein